MVTNNFDEKPVSMTRGSAYVLYKKDGEIWIGSHDEFNGDMYPGGRYEAMIEILKKVHTYEDFGLAMHAFNRENHNYNDFQTYQTRLEDYLGKKVELIDFSDDYYGHWNSDYLFFINLLDEQFSFINRPNNHIKKVHIPVDAIMTFNFGNCEAVYYKEEILNSI